MSTDTKLWLVALVAFSVGWVVGVASELHRPVWTHRLRHWLRLTMGHVAHVRRDGHLYVAHVCVDCNEATTAEHSDACECVEDAAFVSYVRPITTTPSEDA